MPRRVNDFKQPRLAPSAAELGEEAYRANLQDQDGPGEWGNETAGTVPVWKHPEPRNAPPGQHRSGGPVIKLGQDPKE